MFIVENGSKASSMDGCSIELQQANFLIYNNNGKIATFYVEYLFDDLQGHDIIIYAKDNVGWDAPNSKIWSEDEKNSILGYILNALASLSLNGYISK